MNYWNVICEIVSEMVELRLKRQDEVRQSNCIRRFVWDFVLDYDE